MDFERLAQKRDSALQLMIAFTCTKLSPMLLGRYDGYLGDKDNRICLNLEKAGACYHPFAITKN